MELLELSRGLGHECVCLSRDGMYYNTYIHAYNDGFVYDECLANIPFKGLKSQPPGKFFCCRAPTKITHLEDSDFTYP